MKILTSLWQKWLKFGKKIGHFQALIVFTLFYFGIFWIVGLFTSLFSDPLKIKKIKKSNFNLWEHPEENIEQAKNPF